MVRAPLTYLTPCLLEMFCIGTFPDVNCRPDRFTFLDTIMNDVNFAI